MFDMASFETLKEPAVLTSWKEVAAYLGKGVRTVQRWEKHDGLPVRRIAGTSKILVKREDLEQCLTSQPQQSGGPQPQGPISPELRANIEQAKKLRDANAELRGKIHSAVEQLMTECRRMNGFAFPTS
jgi:excisionase family DNA binding protein